MTFPNYPTAATSVLFGATATVCVGSFLPALTPHLLSLSQRMSLRCRDWGVGTLRGDGSNTRYAHLCSLSTAEVLLDVLISKAYPLSIRCQALLYELPTRDHL